MARLFHLDRTKAKRWRNADNELRRISRTLNWLIVGLIVAITGVGVLLLWRFS